MFGKFNNNYQGNSVNVNTKLYVSYSDESLLTLSAWNSNLSLKLSPAKGKNEDGVTTYSTDINENVVASITAETDQVLISGIENEILPALKNNTPASIGVVSGAADKRKIINIVTDGSQVGLSIVFGGTIALDGTSSGTNMLAHTFNERSYIKNYNKDAGGEQKKIPSDFLAFINKLKELKYVDGAIAHGITYSNTIKASFANKPNNNTNTESQVNTYSAPVTNAGDEALDSFLPFN